MDLKLEWKLSNLPLADLGHAIANTAILLVEEHLPDIADMFPFRKCWSVVGHLDETWMVVSIKDELGRQVPTGGELKDEELRELKDKILPFNPRDHLGLYELLGPQWFSSRRFTYAGPYEESMVCRPDLNQHIIDWLNHLVVPDVLERNQSRVLRAIPAPPQYDLRCILDSLWILECEETYKQGTAFMLSGKGLVTCQHVIGRNTYAFRPTYPEQKYKVQTIAQNAVIDLAVLHIDGPSGSELRAGSADNLKQMDHIAVAGFPNYRLGDTGVVIPGLIVGFRMVSGIRRILTNASIVAGNSGGPIFDRNNLVIGVAVTGSDRVEDAQVTENHGIIPIDALEYLSIKE